jgi:hypothetical protein
VTAPTELVQRCWNGAGMLGQMSQMVAKREAVDALRHHNRCGCVEGIEDVPLGRAVSDRVQRATQNRLWSDYHVKRRQDLEASLYLI